MGVDVQVAVDVEVPAVYAAARIGEARKLARNAAQRRSGFGCRYSI
jgi:hypothetical protein